MKKLILTFGILVTMFTKTFSQALPIQVSAYTDYTHMFVTIGKDFLDYDVRYDSSLDSLELVTWNNIKNWSKQYFTDTLSPVLYVIHQQSFDSNDNIVSSRIAVETYAESGFDYEISTFSGQDSIIVNSYVNMLKGWLAE